MKNFTDSTTMGNFSGDNITCWPGLSHDPPVCGSRDQMIEYILEKMKPTVEESVLIFLYVVVFFVGLFGNFLVCFVVYRSKSMQNATNYFIVNLAVTDMLVILICLPPTVVQQTSSHWYFGEVMCHIVVFMQTASIVSSVLTLCAIGVERYYGICLPFESWLSSRRVITIIVMIWTTAAAVSAPHLIYMTLKSTYKDIPEYLQYCAMNMSTQSRKVFQSVLVICVYLIPLLIIGVMYLRISIRLWSASIPGETLKSAGRPSNAMINQKLSRRKISRMLIAVVIIFAVCYLPIHVMYICFIFDVFVGLKDQSFIPRLMMISHWLCYFNSAINPIIYNFMSMKFQSEFKRIFYRMTYRRYPESHGRTESLQLKSNDDYYSTTVENRL
ncbi:orexin/Hypocretin receptor type 1 [Patella vulgata]|uniref:orexin/Hypocretin receptor type 1 n=1 Tax=Patella vulgata TaxID=6465 RepID=UPI0021801087|nr:orexin/Hypocretin receptor type 1 [Patella vulgata]